MIRPPPRSTLFPYPPLFGSEGGASRLGARGGGGPGAGAGADPAAVAFDAVAAARARGVDSVLVDTAGRLHTEERLLDELEKVVRRVAEQRPDAPPESLLVVDPTGGPKARHPA